MGDELHAVRRVNDDGTRTFLGIIPARMAKGVIPQLLNGRAVFEYTPLTQAELALLVPRPKKPESPWPAFTVHLPQAVPVTVNAGAGEAVIQVPLGNITLNGVVLLTLPDGRKIAVSSEGKVTVQIPVAIAVSEKEEIELHLPGGDDLARCDLYQRQKAWDERNPSLNRWDAPDGDPYPGASTGIITIEATHYHD